MGKKKENNFDFDVTEDNNFDFNIEEEYKPAPLAPAGTYLGAVRDVKLNTSSGMITFEIVANGNEGITLNDGETPIDGSVYRHRTFLPKAADKERMTSGGSMSIYQFKVNSIKELSAQMEIDMNTYGSISKAIEDHEWVGIPVLFTLKVGSFNDRPVNDVSSMKRSEEEVFLPD